MRENKKRENKYRFFNSEIFVCDIKSCCLINKLLYVIKKKCVICGII